MNTLIYLEISSRHLRETRVREAAQAHAAREATGIGRGGDRGPTLATRFEVLALNLKRRLAHVARRSTPEDSGWRPVS